MFKNSLSEEEEKKLAKADANFKKVEEETIFAPITDLTVIKKSMLEIIDKHSDANGRILLSELGRLLTRLYSDFDARNYGRYRKFSDFVRDLPEFDIHTIDTVVYAKKAENYLDVEAGTGEKTEIKKSSHRANRRKTNAKKTQQTSDKPQNIKRKKAAAKNKSK